MCTKIASMHHSLSNTPDSVANKLHRPTELLLPLLPSPWPHILNKIVKLMPFNRTLWMKHKIQKTKSHMTNQNFQGLVEGLFN